MTASHSTSQIDVQELHDFPVVLGDSLKDLSRSRSRYVQFRYNWEPSNGFRKHKGTLKQESDRLKLSYFEDKPSAPSATYNGFHTSGNSTAENQQPGLVLVYNETKATFILEKIAASADLNVVSAAELTKDEVRSHQQLQRANLVERLGNADQLEMSDDEEADSSNPFDFRHFLSEAREVVDKAAQQAGNRTPLPGSSTPLPRVASPSVGGGRFANMASLGPTSTAANKKMPSAQPTTKAKPGRKAPVKRKEPVTSKASQPLSKARISDSDEELDDIIPVEPARPKNRSRNTLRIDDEIRSTNVMSGGGGLEIIGASPPPEPRSYKIDVEAFRSQTHTPTFGRSRNRVSPPRTESDDVIMRDASANDSSDEDGDVETFELDGDKRSRRDDQDILEPVDTPPAPEGIDDDGEEDEDEDEDDNNNNGDDDADAALEAELMEALEQEEGAGRSSAMNGYGHVDDDESEISEEE